MTPHLFRVCQDDWISTARAGGGWRVLSFSLVILFSGIQRAGTSYVCLDKFKQTTVRMRVQTGRLD